MLWISLLCIGTVVHAAESAPSPSPQRINALLAEGASYLSQGRYPQADQAFESAVALAEQQGDTRSRAAALIGHGSTLTLTRQWTRAESMLVDAVKLTVAEELQSLHASALMNLGHLYAARGDKGPAMENTRNAVSMAIQLNAPQPLAQTLLNAAVTATALGQAQQAGQWNQQALELLAQLPNVQGDLYVTAGRTEQRLFAATKDAAHRHQALAAYARAIEISKAARDSRSLSYALGYAGMLQEESQNTAEAMRLTREAMFAAQEASAPESLYRWQWQLGRLHRTTGDTELAIKAYRAAGETFESIRDDVVMGGGNYYLLVGFREAVAPLYYELADLLLQTPPAAADDAAESAPTLLDARLAIERFKAAELNEYLQSDCMIRARASVREIESVLKEAGSTAVVYLIPLADRTEILVSLPSGIRRVRVDVTAQKLTDEVKLFRQRLEDRSSHRYLYNARQLNDWLIAPVEAMLKENQIDTLVFVPDGALRTIPMGTLYDGKSFLIERFAIAVTPGLQLMEPRAIARSSINLLACGLTESVQGYESLPYVDQELSMLRKQGTSKELIDTDFSESRLEQEMRATGANIIHIASHGEFRSEASQSFVLTYKGRLTLNALELLIRPAEFRGSPIELLALSACQTAAGDDRAALGLAGVAIKAGARSALATLWYVSDEASTQLIAEFYQQLRGSQTISKAQALQQAQRTLLSDRRFRHPCYWSPYMLIGNWL